MWRLCVCVRTNGKIDRSEVCRGFGGIRSSSKIDNNNDNNDNDDDNTFPLCRFRGAQRRKKIDHHRAELTGKESGEHLIVEGSERPKRHRHVTITPNKRRDSNASGDVTKIEVVLEEAPDAVVVGSMSSELEATAELNSTFPDGIAGTGAVVVRAEEALIVILVLVLWVAAIALFFNRWGKIRMLEPYQPKFQQQHRQSCATVDPNPLQHRNSKFNIHCLEHPVLHQTSCGTMSGPITRLRQNSVFVGSSASLLIGHETPRRAKSAFDLQSLVHAEGARSMRGYQDIGIAATVPEADEERDGDTLRTLRSISEASRLLQRERRSSTTYQFDRMDVLAHPMPLRERGMSICHFDRTDVLARPLQRDRGMSICHFDRTDVLARPLQRDRGMSICHFDRMDVLARPTPPLPAIAGKSLLRERRVSVCNFLERSEEVACGGSGATRSGFLQRQDRRLSVSNSVSDRIDVPGRSLSLSRDYRGSVVNVMMTTPDINSRQLDAGGVKGCAAGIREAGSRNNSAHHLLDRPSCSKTPDVVLGYKATCV